MFLFVTSFLVILVLILAIALSSAYDDLRYEKKKRAMWQAHCKQLLDADAAARERRDADIRLIHEIKQTANTLLAN